SGPPPASGRGMMTEPARSTRPKPELLFGEGPASVGEYWPLTSTAPLMSNALTSAALGVAVPFFTSVSRSTAAQPATSGVAMLVPVSKKKCSSFDVPNVVSGLATRLDNVDSMQVPGATTSGLNRCSLVGPGLESAAMPSGSLAWWSELTGLRGKSPGQYMPYVGVKSGRLLSVAPTVMQFLADGSWEIEPWSTAPLALASVPSFPAAYRITMS